ncbi:uncharacterized protein BO96DRAFT_220628 [Aspergillus niger CBS 101883]|uniref:uncharacterized protein n=1 Tax=Aspergillus lacticoffeatus (strain CBS 101883) TaxID=1450533 RepID=UPI000D7F7AC3|nr:uncharacterized protein BO96DRAFT_220628 [Aspergillus niger CBS 101883]PYH50782.1 hypothetical protein BO96DRAFT_220628 [Aspergillus niger CBS 101883]
MGNNGQLNAAWPMDPSSLHSSIGCPGAVDLYFDLSYHRVKIFISFCFTFKIVTLLSLFNVAIH